jgi:hypothetical protein
MTKDHTLHILHMNNVLHVQSFQKKATTVKTGIPIEEDIKGNIRLIRRNNVIHLHRHNMHPHHIILQEEKSRILIIVLPRPHSPIMTSTINNSLSLHMYVPGVGHPGTMDILLLHHLPRHITHHGLCHHLRTEVLQKAIHHLEGTSLPLHRNTTIFHLDRQRTLHPLEIHIHVTHLRQCIGSEEKIMTITTADRRLLWNHIRL